MPVTDDIPGATNKTKQELQQALLDLLKGNPDILNSVTQAASKQGGHKTETTPRSGDENGRRDRRSPRMPSFPEEENQLNQPHRTSYQWQLSDSDDGIDSAWTTMTKNMSPRELNKWRKSLFSIYVGHLPYDITKKELVQLFSEVGTVQDVHLQPGESRSYTFGFVRFCTLEECHDAVTMLHGRLLGNKTITVEYSSETKERLQGEDPNDLPQDKKDKLLRNDYPEVEHLYRPMSTEESQEKMILWKLRCSATRLKSSSTMSGQENKEELMNRIQEIVRKVASLSADTHTMPSGSEGSPCSPWILKEINGNFVPEEESQFMGAVHLRDNCQKHHTGFGNIEPEVTGLATLKVANKKDLLQMPERQEHSPEANSVTFSSPDRARNIGLDQSEDILTSANPGSPVKDACNSSLSDSVSLGSISPERQTWQHCQFCHIVSPLQEHTSESSQSESTSSSSSQQPLSSPCTFCCEGEEISRKLDYCHLVAEQGSENNQYGRQTSTGYANSQDGRCLGPPSINHYSDMGLSSFDSGNDYCTKPTSVTSELGNHHVHQQMVNSGFLRGQKQTQYSPVTSQRNKASASQQYSTENPIYNGGQANSPFVHQGPKIDPPNSNITNLHMVNQKPAPNSSEVADPKQQWMTTQYPSVEQIREAPFAQQGLQSGRMGPENIGVAKERPRLTHYSLAVTQPQQASAPSHHLNQDKVQVVNEVNKPFAQQGQRRGPVGPASTSITAVPRPQQAPVPTHQEKLQVVNEENKPVDLHTEVQTRHAQNSPDKPEPQQSYVTSQHFNQSLAQQSLFSYPSLANLLGQNQHLQAMQLANMIASGWHQPGFPRHSSVTTGALNPGILQGWNWNPLLQQQLAASRMPFRSPFYGGKGQTSPRFGLGVRNPVPHQGQRHKVPIGRGRHFAPRFHSPVVDNVKAPAQSERSVSEMSKAESLDIRLTEGKNEFDVGDNKKQQSAADDSPKGSDRQEKKPITPYNTLGHVESTGQELLAPGQSQKSPNAEIYKAITPMSDAANSPPCSSLTKNDGDFESPGANKSPAKMTQNELHLKEEKAELKRIVKENERLRQCIEWRNSGGNVHGDANEKRDALRAEIHNKEVQLQKEKEIVMARKVEQEILYEREKLEAAFDQQLKKELKTEKKLGETKNKIYLARLENELLRSYQDLRGVIAIAEKY